ncbi:MAG: DUF4097 family beta strand repeat-containing protein [bacterium]
MTSRLLRPVFAALLVLAPALSAQAPVGRRDSIYTWRGAMPAHALLTIRNFNGPVDVLPADGGTAELRAQKRVRGGSLEDVAFVVRTESNGDVSICSVLGDRDSCGDRGYSSDDDDRGRWRRDVSVAMTVRVPRGTQLKVATGNGEVSVVRVGGEVQASTGNGPVRVEDTEGAVRVSTGNGDVDVRGARGAVRVSTGNGRVNVATSEGPVEVHTGNGNIDVSMAQLKARDDMTFSTGSGSVRVALPAGYNGELDASTGSGDITSDFELKVEGRMNPRRIRATIGQGGPRLRVSSGNGQLQIVKR